MAHAERCPVCYGSGKLQTGTEAGGTNPAFNVCYGCGGKGWVEVQDSTSPFPPVLESRPSPFYYWPFTYWPPYIR